MTRLSLIICTHNPRAEYLRSTLESLRKQSLATEEWELLLIDNASVEHLADSWPLEWHPDASWTREEEVGLTPARLRGIREASGDLLLFVDDDNVLAPDYLEEVVRLMDERDYLGVVGAGVLEPKFEAQPRPAVTHVLRLLALRAVDSERWSNNVIDGPTLPWGAGLCVRRVVADHYVDLTQDLNTAAVLDRRGQQLFCGGDDLFSWAAAELGYGFGIFPQLRIEHLISAARVNPEYLLRLVHDHSFSHTILRYLLVGAEPASFSVDRRIRIMLHGLRNGRFSMNCHLETARGEREGMRFIHAKQLRPLLRSPRITRSPKAVANGVASARQASL